MGSLLLFCYMFRKILLLIFITLFAVHTQAQTDSSGLRISLLTCGPGDEIYEQFGHTAIRVVDTLSRTDIVYNYGTFGFEEDFEIKFMRGKLLYYVSRESFNGFISGYAPYERSVEEHVLQMTAEEKQSVQDYLVWNAKEENRYYKYDFFFDNCATRIRDIFPNALGDKFKFGYTLPEGQNLTFRDIMNQYFYVVHFERVGCNILLGSRIDKVMTNEDVMFLPDFLRDGVAGATVNNKSFVKESNLLSTQRVRQAGPNYPLIVFSIAALLTILGVTVSKLKFLGNLMSFLTLFITGLLGVLMLVMWFWTDHQGCENNFNVLWALPTNLILAFLPKRNKDKYALIGIVCIFISVLLHLLKVQGLPLLELSPLLLSLIFIFGWIVKKNRYAKA